MSTSAPSAPQIPALPGQASQGLALLNQFQQQLSLLRPELLGQAGFETAEVQQQVDPSDIGGLTRADQQTLTREQDIVNRLQAGETSFKDQTGRDVWVDNGVVQFSRGGRIEARVGLQDQLGRSQALIEQTLNKGFEDVRFDPTTGQFTRMAEELQKTPERLAEEERLKELQDISTNITEQQLKLLQEEIERAQSPEVKAELERQQELQRQHQEVVGAQLERQQAALAGELAPSAALQQAEEEGVRTLKEAAARRGIDIQGETLGGLTSESTAGQGMIRNLQQQMQIARQQETQAILGQAPIAQAGLGQAGAFALQPFATGLTGQPGISPFVAAQPGFTGALPQLTTGLPQATQMFGTALSPFMQQYQLQAAYGAQPHQPSGKSQLLGSLAGAGIGAALALPTGGVSVPMGALLGSQFGGAAGGLF